MWKIQRRMSCVISMFQDSLFKQSRGEVRLMSLARSQFTDGQQTPSLIVSMRLQVSDRRVPGIRLRLHRVGGSVASSLCYRTSQISRAGFHRPVFEEFRSPSFAACCPRAAESRILSRFSAALCISSSFCHTFWTMWRVAAGQPEQ